MIDRNVEITKLLGIISNFRNGELPIKLDEKHIQKWLSQFNVDAQDIILSEMVHVFSDWYFNIASIRKYLEEVYNKVHCSYNDNFDEVSFLDCQKSGRSQHKLLLELKKSISNMILSSFSSPTKHLIYLDDGLYSGNHIIQDNEALIRSSCAERVETIDVFVMVGYSSGIEYVNQRLKSLCNKHGIKFSLFHWRVLENRRGVQISGNSEYIYSSSDVLWPLKPKYQSANDINSRIEKLTDKKMHYEYRTYAHHLKSRVFSNDYNRMVIENEFLEKGSIILSDSSVKKGLYPLGFSTYPSLGFGSFCASDYNISNTCPLVLWWGNIQKKGDILDAWYPLLPRRTNDESGDNNIQE